MPGSTISKGTRAAAAMLVLLAGAPACARKPVVAEPTPPDLAAATGQARCAVRRSADKPLVVEWPAVDRAALEAHAREGLVAVRYEGCAMEVLDGCRVDGRYGFVPTSPKQERVTIRSEDELYARLPVGAAGLEATLARAGLLVVDMTIVGRKQADRHVFARDELHGRCGDATHVLTGLTVGAFSLSAGAELEAGARAQLGAAGAAAAFDRAREVVSRDGDPGACEAEAGAAEPPPSCGALLRVEAVPLAEAPSTPFVPATALAPSLALAPPSPLAPGIDAAQAQPRFDRAAAWRGTAIAAGVASGASFGGVIGGIVLLGQADSQPVWEDLTPENQRKRTVGTGMLIGASIGFVAFGALALGGASAAQRAETRRYAWVAPTIDRHSAGLGVAARF